MKKISTLFSSLIFAALSLSVLAEEIRVCNSCGYELATPSAKFCSNCGTAAGASPSVTVSPKLEEENPDTSDSSSSHENIDVEHDTSLINTPLTDEDYDIVRSAIMLYEHKISSLSKKNSNSVQNVLLCYLYLCEAEGLLRLLPASDTKAQNKLKLITASKSKILKIIPKDYSAECKRCKGEGYIDFRYLTHDNIIEKKEKSVICPLCNTRKIYPIVLDFNTLNRLFTQAKFEVHQFKEENSKLQILIERRITSTRPTVPQQAAYLKATTLPCEHCFGFKIEQCGKCKGSGLINCKEASCDNGYKKSNQAKTGNSKIKRIENLQSIQRCSECDGTTFVKCDICDGHGANLCTRCDGTGSKDICSNCSGIGYEECTRCKRTLAKGNSKARICTNCFDNKLVLCKTCDGSGVK